MDYAILAGGPPVHLPDLTHPRFANVRWVGVDRGAFRLMQRGIRPVKAFGDFDSISADERAFLQARGLDLAVFPAEKDKTDLEIAVDWVLTQKPERCWIVGATGGRLDHTLMNVQLLLKAVRSRTEMFLIDAQNIAAVLPPGTYDVPRSDDHPYLSFIALTPKASGLSLSGVKYPLDDAELTWGSSLCISNEWTAETAKVIVGQGIVLMVQSKDVG